MYHTNTWGGRNTEQLEYLVTAIKEKLFNPLVERDKELVRPIRVLDIGPGGVPIQYKDLCQTRPVRTIKSSADRKMQKGPLWTYEPLEILTAFKDFQVELVVVDIDPRVCACVKPSLEKSTYAANPVEVLNADIQKKLPDNLSSGDFDAVIMNYVYPYLDERQLAFENVTKLVAPRGFYTITATSSNLSLTKKMWRTVSGKTDDDYIRQIEAQVAHHGSDYVDTIDIAGRLKFSKVIGKFPLYQREFE